MAEVSLSVIAISFVIVIAAVGVDVCVGISFGFGVGEWFVAEASPKRGSHSNRLASHSGSASLWGRTEVPVADVVVWHQP